MNEKRKATHDYYSPTVSKNQETIDSLYYAINTFFKNYCGKLSGADWIYLDNILKQLRNKKNIFITCFVSHLEISGKVINELQ